MEALHILFTMDCERVIRQSKHHAKTWEQSARSIDGFASCLLSAGYPVTLFVAPECAQELSPLMEELAGRGAEIGLFVDPPRLGNGHYSRPLGQYKPEHQHEIITLAAGFLEDALGMQPRSFRSGDFSASDDTFKVLYELGFRQGSLSKPGQNLPRQAASWVGAPVDAHYVDLTNRLRVGSFPFLELPATTDPAQYVYRGVPYELRIEMGTFADWVRPFIDSQIERMASEQVDFRSICIGTGNSVAYAEDDRASETIDALIDYFDVLGGSYEIVPVTLAGAHERFRSMR